ncbi:hypothetical protein Vafri_3200 [Volvox africanus]|uniref:Uncharacterized protein n=1 Tax=Volvox africanus TaxID=51714 RepID=A0A8J4ETG0_9CHLO|nr:hypothetical protein Vafri_3200 [Volvox africanus]
MYLYRLLRLEAFLWHVACDRLQVGWTCYLRQCAHSPPIVLDASHDRDSYFNFLALVSPPVLSFPLLPGFSQSHLRGWLVRRSSALWWARASHSLRERRAAVRAWRQHQRFMTISYGMQAQLLGALVREAQVAEALRADRRRQEAEMRTAFNDWLLQQQRVALSQPLPRGWVPHPHPNEPGRMCFLNTRTGELHALHPVVADLARHAREQHSAAMEALQQRFAGVPAYLAQLHEATAAQAAIALRAIAITYQSAAVPAPLPAGGATRAQASI